MRNAVILAICLVAAGCKGKREDVAAPAPSSSSTAKAPPSAMNRSHLVRDEEGRLVPTRPRPEDNPADIPAAPSSQPAWDLDRAEPARDYVARYVRATRRYGDATRCVSTKAAGSRDGKAIVEVRDREPPTAGCTAPGGGGPRDTFLVDVDRDRLELAKGGPLAKWPDGSDPSGPPAAPSAIEADAPPTKLRDALVIAKLTPVRTQLYGRGSYPVITLAGWRDPITRDAPPESLAKVVDAMCAASEGSPFGVFGGIDRSTILRVRCGEAPGARWEKL